MAILNVVKLYDNNLYIHRSCLREVCKPVEKNELKEEWLHQLIKDMFATLYFAPAGVGLSANQVGVMSQICVIDPKRDGKKPMVLINPSYIPLSDKKNASYESCISVPLKTAKVERFEKIQVSYMDLSGVEHTIIEEGFRAKLLQHEIDHLYGKVYVDLVDQVDDNLVFPERLAEQAYQKVSVM